MAEQAVAASMDEISGAFGQIDVIQSHLERVRADLVQNAELFLQKGSSGDNGPFPVPQAKFHNDPSFHRYAVNVMVSNASGEATGAPIISEPYPTLANLIGRVEHISTMGTLITDFTLIKPGALHRANGGFLVIDASRVLSEPFAWDALKRCLEMQAIQITSAAEMISLMATTSLEPEPIPLNVRVVLLGSPQIHMLLVAIDPDFGRLFKVGADFSEDMSRDTASLRLFARLIATVAIRDKLRPVSRDGVAALIDVASRIAGNQEKLSLSVGTLLDVIREADYLAEQSGSPTVSAAEIVAARKAAENRTDRMREQMQEMMARDAILISTQGSQLGQINGLTVTSAGTFVFGMPVRITARVRVGSGQVVDISREVKMGGPIHSKGVLILSSYLATHYAPDVPLSLWASLVFEQTYGGVEGDSASVAELCALLSALARLPLSQSMAVTGSVNQMGEVQPIGGVNEKIEGFFDLCKIRGLTGKQGVIIPKQNIKNLMLRDDVVEAVSAGQFQVHNVSHVDEAMELLTGLPAGRRRSNGAFEDGTVNGNVEARLMEFAETLRDFNQPGSNYDDYQSNAE